MAKPRFDIVNGPYLREEGLANRVRELRMGILTMRAMARNCLSVNPWAAKGALAQIMAEAAQLLGEKVEDDGA